MVPCFTHRHHCFQGEVQTEVLSDNLDKFAEELTKTVSDDEEDSAALTDVEVCIFYKQPDYLITALFYKQHFYKQR